MDLTGQVDASTNSNDPMITKLLVLDFQHLWQKPCCGMSDKISAPKKKGMWMGGAVPLGYEVKDRALVINEAEFPVNNA